MKANIPRSFEAEKRERERKLKEMLKKIQNQKKDPAIEEFEVRKQYENGF